MAGRMPIDSHQRVTISDADRAAMRQSYIANVKLAARACQEQGITTLIEPINNRDIPGYFLNYQQDAHDILHEVGEPNLKVQMDFYHVQIMEGDIEMRLRKHFANVGHVQIAGVPKRNEPDIGEVNFPYLFTVLDELGYNGHVGCEYNPRAGTSENLGWIRPYLK
jgi:hydroxypyruvate isomerase